MGGHVHRVAYEGLSVICFACGTIGHKLDDCSNKVEKSNDQTNMEQVGSKANHVKRDDFDSWMVVPHQKNHTQMQKGKGVAAAEMPGKPILRNTCFFTRPNPNPSVAKTRTIAQKAVEKIDQSLVSPRNISFDSTLCQSSAPTTNHFQILSVLEGSQPSDFPLTNVSTSDSLPTSIKCPSSLTAAKVGPPIVWTLP